MGIYYHVLKSGPFGTEEVTKLMPNATVWNLRHTFRTTCQRIPWYSIVILLDSAGSCVYCDETYRHISVGVVHLPKDVEWLGTEIF